MTKKELLESYDFHDVPEQEQDEYLRHIISVVYDAKSGCPSLSVSPLESLRKSEGHPSQVNLQVRLAMALCQSRAVTETLLLLAEECIQSKDAV